MTKKPVPQEWGLDKLSQFVDDSMDNSYCTFVNLRAEYDRLCKIDEIFRKASECLTNSKHWFIGIFMMRAHSPFLGAAKLAVGTQLVESFMVQRGCLENSLYGYYLFHLERKDPATDYYEVWFNRHSDDEWYKRFDKTFKYGKARCALNDKDKELGSIAHELYRRSIDFGAHPNPHGVLTNIEIIEKGKHKIINSIYLNGDETPLKMCLKSVAQVGCCSLSIFEHVFKKRFQIAGIDTMIARAKRGL